MDRPIICPKSDLKFDPDLKVLDLSNRNIKSLYGLERFKKLVLLDLSGNKELPSEEVEQLRQLLPNCTILYVDETVVSQMKGSLRITSKSLETVEQFSILLPESWVKVLIRLPIRI